ADGPRTGRDPHRRHHRLRRGSLLPSGAPTDQEALVTIEVAGLWVAYDGVPALRELSVRVPAGGWLAPIGPNGAGKTTLLRALAGLVPFSGHVRVEESSITSVAGRRLAQLVAYVPQRPEIPGSMAVTDYVLLGRTPYIPYLGTERRNDLD